MQDSTGFPEYFASLAALLTAAVAVFRNAVRRSYRRRRRLSPVASFLELLVWALFFSFPYIYNPPEWAEIWLIDYGSDAPLRVAGLVFILLGMIGAFGTMIWFGLRRAFGLKSDELIQRGPYRVSRNPQIAAGVLMVVGCVMQYPSWYAIGWVFAYGAIAHMMVLTEEEHLLDVFGEEYAEYCRNVPRYIALPPFS